MIIQVFCESDPLRGMNLLQRGLEEMLICAK